MAMTNDDLLGVLRTALEQRDRAVAEAQAERERRRLRRRVNVALRERSHLRVVS